MTLKSVISLLATLLILLVAVFIGRTLWVNYMDTPWTRDQIEALQVGFVPLELIPRGVGKLLIRAPRLYQIVESGDSLQMQLVVKNEGTRRLDNIEIIAEIPLRWRKKVRPAVISNLGISEEKTVVLTFFPPHDIAAGKYEMRIRSRSLSDNQTISGADKIFTAEIRAPSNTLGTIFVLLLILGVVSGIIIFGVRLTRR